MTVDLVSSFRCFNGYQKLYKHLSSEVKCEMKFSLYEPLDVQENPADVLFYLPGAHSSGEEFTKEVGCQFHASKHRFILVGVDTSPRGPTLPENTGSGTMALGEGIGAFVDATKEPWSNNYRMYSYVTKELPALIKQNFRTTGRFGILGHSLGGHGALVIGLRNPHLFQSVSALAPMTNAYKVVSEGFLPYDQYIGREFKDWAPYDACELAKNYNGPELDILLDQGLEDEHILTLLRPENFRAAVQQNKNKIKLTFRLHEGFEHSAAFFVKTFIEDHFQHHARILRSLPFPAA